MYFIFFRVAGIALGTYRLNNYLVGSTEVLGTNRRPSGGSSTVTQLREACIAIAT